MPDSNAQSGTHHTVFIQAPPEIVYRAVTDPAALAVWRVPGDMTGQVHQFDYRVGGGYEMSLYYPASEPTERGKTAGREDRYTARFVEIQPPHRIVEAITFHSGDPAFAGEMTMIVTLEPAEGGTNVAIAFQDLPPGIRLEDNEAGTVDALGKLARYVESGAGRDSYSAANRDTWNARTPHHIASTFYDVPAFKAGANRLRSIEREELGDVRGKSLLHLQCHFGLDTLSWARLGATVTGVDFSEDAIAYARELAGELGLPASFVCSDIYHLPEALDGQFDIVFTSYGVLSYLSDLHPWAEVISRFLKPGGSFYMVEFHPFAAILDAVPPATPHEEPPELRVADGSYFYAPTPARVGGPSYAGSDAAASEALYVWSHSLGEILTPLSEAGLHLEFLHEFPYAPKQRFPNMEQGPDGWWHWKDPLYRRAVPLLFSLKATKIQPR